MKSHRFPILAGLVAALSLLPLAALADDNVNTDADGLAIHGYDPVAYFASSRAVPGSSEFTVSHEGAIYRFASAANRDAFVAEPERYVPRYGGYCAMGMTAGQRIDVDPTAFRIVDGALYLNVNPSVQQRWLEDVEANIDKADENWRSAVSE